MRIYHKLNSAIAEFLRAGGVGVMPTDTIYGIVGSALKKRTVERIYKLRRRNLRKPMIVLIASLADLKKFGVRLTAMEKKILHKIWPAKVSVVLSLKAKSSKLKAKFKYLHRGTKTLAFRLPKPRWLRKLLAAVGPLVAPSANWEGEKPARTVREARRYFGDKIEFYVNAGRCVSEPSTLVALRDGRLKILREGAVKVR